MTGKARELLERALEALDFDRGIDADDLMEAILEYLAQPEVKREALNYEQIKGEWLTLPDNINLRSFEAGVRFAEKHHGIGGEDDWDGA